MALPTLNSDFSFELVQPSTKQTVRFRPYLVKEEKQLLMAAESQNKVDMMKAIRDIVSTCYEDIDAGSIPLFDLEYMFLNLRAKSAGEITEVGFPCSECDATNPVALNLEDITIDGIEDKAHRIKLSDSIVLEMRYPKMNDIISNPDVFLQEGRQVEMIFALIDALIDKVYTDEDVIDFQDESKKSREAFVESMNTSQFNEVKEFVENIPQAKTNVVFDCTECGHHNERELDGLSNFFG